MTNLRSAVQFQYPHAYVADLGLGSPKNSVPIWVLWQGQLQFPSSEVYAGARHRFGLVPDEDVRSQGIVHVVPRVLHQLLVVLETENLQVHDNYLK